MPGLPAAEPDRDDARIDAMILQRIPLRAVKMQAPDRVQPTAQWSPDETRQRFLDARIKTISLLSDAPALRGHVAPHPFFGNLDGYQWIIATGAHSARHTAQILEVKAAFPALTSATN